MRCKLGHSCADPSSCSSQVTHSLSTATGLRVLLVWSPSRAEVHPPGPWVRVRGPTWANVIPSLSPLNETPTHGDLSFECVEIGSAIGSPGFLKRTSGTLVSFSSMKLLAGGAVWVLLVISLRAGPAPQALVEVLGHLGGGGWGRL